MVTLPMDMRCIVGQNVRKFREELGFSQEDLAFEAELHRTHVSGIECGVRNPTVLTVAQLAKALKVQLYELLKP